MTERALPRVGVGPRPRPLPHARPVVLPRPVVVDTPHTPDTSDAGARTAHRAAHRTTARREALLGTPSRAGMLIGASAAMYAVTLAGVSVLQAGTDAQTAARRAPFEAAIAETRAANDEVEARLGKVDLGARALAADYDSVGRDMTAFQARLDSLAMLVAEVQGSAAALPARINLPTVSMHGSVGTTRRTHATTSASGTP